MSTPLSVYYSTSGEVSVALGMPIEGFFDGVDIVVEAMAFASTVAQGAPTKALIPSPKSVSVEEST